MSDGELTRLVSEGRDSLTQQAAHALSAELKTRALTDDLLAFECATPKPGNIDQDTSIDQGTSPKGQLRRALLEDLRKLHAWQIIVIIIAFVSAITAVFLRQREATQDELYRKVLINLGTPESRSAFNQLITYHGAHARELVLRLATDRFSLLGDTTQTDAIRVLGQTGDSETAERGAASTTVQGYSSTSRCRR